VAALLYRLGSFAHRRHGLVLAVWIAVLALLGVGSVTLAKSMASTPSIPGTESQQAIDLLKQRMPQASVGDASASIVFTAEGTGKVIDAARITAIQQALQKVSALAHVVTVVDPFKAKVISRDQRTAIANVVYDIPSDKVTGAEQKALEAAGRSAASDRLQVEFGGSAVAPAKAALTSEIVAVGIAAFVLLITFGSLVAAGLPLVTAAVGVASSLFCIQIATRFFDLQSATLDLALMLGLAVGIDYCLFIVSCYQHELITGRSGEDAAGRAVGTAGGAVLFAGLTVIIALSALAVVGIPFLTAIGLGAAGAVLAAVLVALTLLPAVLGFVGGRVLGRRGRAARDAEGDASQSSLGERWGRLVTRFRVPMIAAIVIALLVCAIPALHLRLGMPNDGSSPSGSTQLLAYKQTAKAFGPGFNGPLMVAVDLSGTNDPKAAAAAIQKDVSALPGIAYVAPPTLNQAGNTAIVSVIPTSGPSDQATSDLVKAIRAHASSWKSSTGAKAFVTGVTAVGIDTAQKLQGALIPYLAVVVGLAFVLLTIVFRSLLVPLKAVLGFLLSILATFGALVAVFQWGWLRVLIGLSNPGPILAFAPIFLIGILFGLAMDYEVFLVTRIREERMRGDTANDAIAVGFRHGARVVAAAAVIMISVFGGFMLQADPVIKTLGFAFAFGVLVDAFLVRMTFGPAVMSLLGERAWWLPSWLDRILPNVDIEGLGLPGSEDAPVRDGDACERKLTRPGQALPEAAE
jgi:putative drug exporter of the RND superfamily